MNGSIILRVLSGFLMIFAIPAAGCSVWAFLNDRYQQASLFILVLTVCLVVGVVLSVATSHRKSESAQAKDVVGFLIAAWLVLTFLGSIPFMDVTDGQLALAIFEAVSCATTTGTTLLPDGIVLPASLVAWRGVLHLLGAVLTISGVIMVVNLVGASLPGLGASVPVRFNMEFSRQSFYRIYLSIGLLTLLLTGIFAIPILADGASLREAYGLSVGAFTSGKVLEFESFDFRPSWISELALCVALFLGSVNMVLLFNVLQRPFKLIMDRETLSIFALILLLAGILFFQFGSDAGVLRVISLSASIVSTSGLVVSGNDLNSIPAAVLLFFGFIGGAAISATGGMKIYRMVVLLSRAGNEFATLAQPNAVTVSRGESEKYPVQFVLTVWAYLVAFAVICMVFAGMLALMGAEFTESLMTSLGSITNSAALIPTDWIHASETKPLVEFSMSCFMILGRLELLLLLSLIMSD